MILLVPQIHPLNLPLYWILAFFVTVQTGGFHRTCPRSLRGRIHPVDISRYLTWRQAHCFRSRVMQLWEGLLDKVPTRDWNLRYRGNQLDFTTKAKQDLAERFERLMVLQEVRRQQESDARVFIISSPEFRYISRLDPPADFLQYPERPVLAAVNIALDYLFMYAYNCSHLSIILLRILYSRLRRDQRNSLPTTPMRYIWDAANPNEMTLDPERRYFSWIVDDEQISLQDVLFILPSGVDRKSRPEIDASGHQAFGLEELYRLLPTKVLRRSALDLLSYLAKYIFSLPAGLPSVHQGDYFAKTVRLQPIIDHLQPRCYITSVSQMGNENPAIVHLNSLGIDTVMYSYSAGLFQPFGNEDCTCDFRDRTYANLITSYLVVWHQAAREFLYQHPQDQVRILVGGPLMPGDEGIFAHRPTVLRTKLGLTSGITSDNVKYISLFDIQSPGHFASLESGRLPDSSNMEYATAFLQDMVKLLDDFANIALVFKPQKSLQNQMIEYGEDYRSLLARINDSHRGFIVSNDINPWMSIAVADLCIAMPFTSPGMAAMHYGIPAIYHDPLSLGDCHVYRSISPYITHDYNQLKLNVSSIVLNNPPCYNQKREEIWTTAHEFIGEPPGSNSSIGFRKFLSDLVTEGSDHDASR